MVDKIPSDAMLKRFNVNVVTGVMNDGAKRVVLQITNQETNQVVFAPLDSGAALMVGGKLIGAAGEIMSELKAPPTPPPGPVPDAPPLDES